MTHATPDCSDSYEYEEQQIEKYERVITGARLLAWIRLRGFVPPEFFWQVFSAHRPHCNTQKPGLSLGRFAGAFLSTRPHGSNHVLSKST